LINKLQTIEQKVDQMAKQVGCAWMPKLVLQKAQFFSFELQIKIDPRNPAIFEKFSEFVKKISQEKWEKPNFKFALYLDMLDQNANTGKVVAADQTRR